MKARGRRWPGRAAAALLAALSAYIGLAYVLAPAVWRHYEHHPAMAAAPKTTLSPEGTPGDPLNVGLIGLQEEVVRAFLAAGWTPADPITLRSSLGIAESVLLERPDPAAPVSPEYLWGRRQDLALEQAVGGSARERHHVRLWRSEELGVGGRPLWLGAATFDRGVGFSHLTGQVTHHIAPDIDAERDTLIADLSAAGRVARVYRVTGVGPTLWARNGQGDRYATDGDVAMAVLTPDNARRERPPERLPDPAPVAAKNALWSWLRGWLANASG